MNAIHKSRELPCSRTENVQCDCIAFLGSTPIGGPLVGWISQSMGPRIGLGVGALAADFYLQTVETVFVRHALPKGEMTHRGRPVDPARIKRVALLTFEGEHVGGDAIEKPAVVADDHGAAAEV